MDGVPAELFDPTDRVWGSMEATEAWLVALGLPFPPPDPRFRDLDSVLELGPLTRFEWGRDAWCLQAGWTRTWGAGTHLWTDLNRTNAAGIPQVTNHEDFIYWGLL